MKHRLDVRYTQSSGLDIAYTVLGQGPLDVVFVPGFASHLHRLLVDGAGRSLVEHLSSVARLIVFDKRGTGLSDRTVPVADLDARMDDLRAVMDAAHADKAVLFGLSEGGPMSILFASSFPDRVVSLVLWAAFARRRWAPDFPMGVRAEAAALNIDRIRREWGNGYTARVMLGDAADEASIAATAQLERDATTPSGAARLSEIVGEIDVRPVCSAIRCPTLIVHRTGDPVVSVLCGRDLANRIPGAKYVELPGDFHVALPAAGQSDDDLFSFVEEFITGDYIPRIDCRQLSTVLFTDIVDSTDSLARKGDARWRVILDGYDDIVRREVRHARGKVVKSTGDGTLCTFDGPTRAIRCAQAIARAVEVLGLDIRAGLHTAEIELRDDDVAGIAVHIAARVASHACAGEVLVSRTVKDLVAGSGIVFEDRGLHVLKGVPDSWELFAAR